MSALTESTFSGHRPSGAGDLSVETHGIAPIAEDQRYGTPRRLFTVWFAPQVNMTGVFTGALAIVLGLGFWLGLLAMVIGTVLGSLVVGYLSTWGPRFGVPQLVQSRGAFGYLGNFLPAGLNALTPGYLKQLGVINAVPGNEADIPYLLKVAMDGIAFLPFGLLVDKWRWEVFSGEVQPADYNKTWWDLKLKYQGVIPPGPRPADAFDPGAKNHIATSVPYARY